MKTRILTALVMAAVGIPMLIFSKYIIYAIAAGVMCLFAVYEMATTLGTKDNLALNIPAYIVALAAPICAYFFAAKLTAFVSALAAILFIYLLYIFAYSVIMRGKMTFTSVTSSFVGTAYIIVSFTCLTLIRYIENGAYYFLLVFVASWICDIFAYFVGRAIGKHKLIPEISPKKTVEGAIGGVAFTVIAFLIYGIVVSYIGGAPTPNYFVLAVLGLVLSVVSQFGDLIASLIKREHGVKDYGKIFPGHGGVLDRFDSVVAVAPVLFTVCVLFPPFA